MTPDDDYQLRKARRQMGNSPVPFAILMVVVLAGEARAADPCKLSTLEIPVTLVDGRRHDFWRVDADRLRAALR